MEIEREVYGGQYTADGQKITGACISLHLRDLELSEFKQFTDLIIRTFGADPTDTALRKNRKVVVAAAGEVHDGGVPSAGRLCDV